MTIEADIRATLVDLIDITNRWPRAHAALHDMRAGYPSTASGSSEGAGGGTTLTRPEAAMEATLAHDANHDRARNDLGNASRLASSIQRQVRELQEITQRYNPTAAPPTRRPIVTDDDLGDDWCTSCVTDDGHLEPVTLRPAKGDDKASPYYAGLCKWCGEFRENYKKLPPKAILRARHQGRRITVQQIERAMIEQRAKTKQRRKK